MFRYNSNKGIYMYDISYPPFYRYLVLVETSDSIKVMEFSIYEVAVACLKTVSKLGNEAILIDNLVPEDVPF